MEHLGKKILNYKLTRFIGEGGMAVVYEGTHEKLGTKVAVKILNPILTANKQLRQRFENEAKFMASLHHNNIVKVLDYNEQPDMLAIIMELLEGQDLDTLIKTNGALKPETAMPLFTQILDAFDYAHSQGIIHRDIKPSNIFVDNSNQIKILDFGIAKILETSEDFTTTGTQMGTPVYMSPEQVKADKNIDHRSDIYSLGVTLFFILHGKPPYDTSVLSAFEIFNKIVHEPIPDLLQFPAINKIIQKAVAKNRDQRFSTASEFKNALLAATNTDTDNNDTLLIKPSTNNNQTLIEKPKQPKREKKVAPAIQKYQNTESTLLAQEVATNQNRNKVLGGIAAVVLALLCYFFLYSPNTVGQKDDVLVQLPESQPDTIAEQKEGALAQLRKLQPDTTKKDSSTKVSIKNGLVIKKTEKGWVPVVVNDSIQKMRKQYVGEHLFGCFFIGSDIQFGKVLIEENNGALTLSGRHEKNGNYVTINGKIKVISLRKFEFTGTIKAHNMSEKDPDCVWNGSTIFWASGTRVYWRTQEQSCFGLTGDMDIYFKKTGT